MELFRQELIRLLPHLRRYARALINHNEAADDLVQDCLERVLSKQHLWDPDKAMKPWLLTILHNVFANNARQYRRTPSLISIHDIEEISDTVCTSDIYLNDLQYALEQLSPEHREVILLVGLEQMSYKDTARILDIPLGTIMSRLTRARQNLRKIMNNTANTAEAV